MASPKGAAMSREGRPRGWEPLQVQRSGGRAGACPKPLAGRPPDPSPPRETPPTRPARGSAGPAGLAGPHVCALPGGGVPGRARAAVRGGRGVPRTPSLLLLLPPRPPLPLPSSCAVPSSARAGGSARRARSGRALREAGAPGGGGGGRDGGGGGGAGRETLPLCALRPGGGGQVGAVGAFPAPEWGRGGGRRWGPGPGEGEGAARSRRGAAPPVQGAGLGCCGALCGGAGWGWQGGGGGGGCEAARAEWRRPQNKGAGAAARARPGPRLERAPLPAPLGGAGRPPQSGWRAALGRRAPSARGLPRARPHLQAASVPGAPGQSRGAKLSANFILKAQLPEGGPGGLQPGCVGEFW